jgi:hypothetical protein
VLLRMQGPLGLPLALGCALVLSQIAHLFPRTDWGHLVFVLPATGVQLLMVCARAELRAAPRLQRAAHAFAAGLIVLAGVSGLGLAWQSQRSEMGSRVRERPVGESARYENLGRVVRYLRKNTRPGDPIFVARAEPLIYFATDTVNPTPYPGVIPAIQEEQEQTITAALERTRFVVMSEIDQPTFTYYRDELPQVQDYLERFYRIPDDFIRAGRNWILVLERDRDRGQTLLDFFRNAAEGRRWRFTPQGEMEPAEDIPYKLPSQYNRRPLAVDVGTRGGGIDFQVDVPPESVLQVDVGRRPTRGPAGYLGPPIDAVASVWIAEAGPFRQLAAVAISPSEYKGESWIPLEVDLAPYSGKRVTLRFQFRSEKDLQFPYGWFGSPRIATRGPQPQLAIAGAR